MKKRGAQLGQHFLKGEWAARALARAASISPGDTVLEIGPGKGALTRELLATGAHVIAVEKDEALAHMLNDGFRKSIQDGRLDVKAADIRDIDPNNLGLKNGQYIVAANIPYYITGEIIRTFLSSPVQPKTIALLIQKEVARRIVDKKQSLLSLAVKAYGAPRVVAIVSRGNFSPPPSVDSAILSITGISRDFFVAMDEELFFKLLHAGFASKRKFLSSNLSPLFGKENVARAFERCGLSTKIRAEDVALERWRCLTKELSVII